MGETDPCEYYRQRTMSIVLDYDKYLMLERFLALKEEEIALAKIDTEDGNIIKDEFIQSIAFLKIIHKLNIAYNDRIELTTRIKLLNEVTATREDFVSEQKRLWLYRNKSGGLTNSLSYIDKFYRFVEMTLNYIRGGDNEAQI